MNDTLRCLFLNGPTWDGDIPDKTERTVLITAKLADRMEGWTFLTRMGLARALELGLNREKERRDRDRREKLLRLERELGKQTTVVMIGMGHPPDGPLGGRIEFPAELLERDAQIK